MQEETQTATIEETTTKVEVNETPSQVVKEKTAKTKTVEVLPYFAEAKVTCACGNKFTTGSTKAEIRVEICNNCHPFFTGQEKFVDTEGRVERFKRMEDAKKESKAKKSVEKKSDQPKTLKEMLMSLSDK